MDGVAGKRRRNDNPFMLVNCQVIFGPFRALVDVEGGKQRKEKKQVMVMIFGRKTPLESVYTSKKE
jgi:hypothetical protein